MTQIGDRIKQKSGWATVTEYYNATNIIVTFDDGTKVNTEAGQFRKGSVRNYNTPSIFGIGVIGCGTYGRSTHLSLYNYWHHILRCCYSATARDTMDPLLHNLQHFCNELTKVLNYDKLDTWVFTNIDRVFNCNQSVHWDIEKIVVVPRMILTHNHENNCNQLPTGVNEWSSAKYKRRYYASIEIDGISNHLGSYSTVDEALCAYNDAKISRAKQLCILYPTLDPRIIERLCPN